MSTEPNDKLPFPSDEQELHARLLELQTMWQAEVKDENFTVDGFYPYYTHQPVKVLFVGREGIGLAGCSYIEALFHAYKVNRIGNRTVNRYAFHRRLLYILYGIMHGFPAWKSVPYAREIAQDFGTPQGVSCAFINMSKSSNESTHWATQREVYNRSVVEGKCFLKQEIAMLAPDIIISGNLDISPAVESPITPLGSLADGLLDAYELQLNGRRVVWFNTFHFSAFTRGRGRGGVRDYETFYQPIGEAFAKWCPELAARIIQPS